MPDALFPADIVTYNERRAYLRGMEDGRRAGPTLVAIHATNPDVLKRVEELLAKTGPSLLEDCAPGVTP